MRYFTKKYVTLPCIELSLFSGLCKTGIVGINNDCCYAFLLFIPTKPFGLLFYLRNFALSLYCFYLVDLSTNTGLLSW